MLFPKATGLVLFFLEDMSLLLQEASSVLTEASWRSKRSSGKKKKSPVAFLKKHLGGSRDPDVGASPQTNTSNSFPRANKDRYVRQTSNLYAYMGYHCKLPKMASLRKRQNCNGYVVLGALCELGCFPTRRSITKLGNIVNATGEWGLLSV